MGSVLLLGRRAIDRQTVKMGTVLPYCSRYKKTKGGEGRAAIPSTLPGGVRTSSVDARMFADLRMMPGVCVVVGIRSQIVKIARALETC